MSTSLGRFWPLLIAVPVALVVFCGGTGVVVLLNWPAPATQSGKPGAATAAANPASARERWKKEQRKFADVRYSGRTVGEWAEDLRDRDAKVAFPAGEVLGRGIGEPALPFLAEIVLDGPKDARSHARVAMIQIGRPSVPYLLDVLRCPDKDAGAEAAFALAWISKGSRDVLNDADFDLVLTTLRAATKEEHGSFRKNGAQEAIDALGDRAR